MIKLYLRRIEILVADLKGRGEILDTNILSDTAFLGLCILGTDNGDGIIYLVDLLGCLVLGMSAPERGLTRFFSLSSYVHCILTIYMYPEMDNALRFMCDDLTIVRHLAKYERVERITPESRDTFVWNDERGDFREVWLSYSEMLMRKYLFMANPSRVRENVLLNGFSLDSKDNVLNKALSSVQELESNYPIEILN